MFSFVHLILVIHVNIKVNKCHQLTMINYKFELLTSNFNSHMVTCLQCGKRWPQVERVGLYPILSLAVKVYEVGKQCMPVKCTQRLFLLVAGTTQEVSGPWGAWVAHLVECPASARSSLSLNPILCSVLTAQSSLRILASPSLSAPPPHFKHK